MDAETARALMVIVQFCLTQNDCRKCAMREFCQKMPCEWL